MNVYEIAQEIVDLAEARGDKISDLLTAVERAVSMITDAEE